MENSEEPQHGTSVCFPEERVFYHTTDGAGILQVHVRNGRIIRVRPAQLTEEDLKKSWTLNIEGKIFKPPKPSVAPFSLASRRRVYSPDRILYPMKRVDFDPNGNRHPENRGKSEFVRISWEEALTLTSNELKRVKNKYGPSGIYLSFPAHWQHGGEIHEDKGPCNRLLCLGLGGYTSNLANADSWEGWYYGGAPTWGFLRSCGIHGRSNSLQDTLENSKMVVAWSSDPLSTRVTTSGGYDVATYLHWVKKRSIPFVFISPDVNYTCGRFADKWIPILAGTDSALALAIAYTWIREGTYDKDYVANKTVGFDAWKNYVIGISDGVPKAPEWAEPITGVKAAVARALAREWASKPTMLLFHYGGACRSPYAHEWCRMMILLQAMQGMGKPGVNIWSGTGAPLNPNFKHTPIGAETSIPNLAVTKKAKNPVHQMIWRLFLADAILNPPITWYGLALMSLRTGVLPNFVPPGTDWYEAHLRMPWSYPQPGESEIHAIYRLGGSQMATWCETGKLVRAYRSPKIEFIVTVDYWWSSESRFSDVILPATTTFERDDISGWMTSQGAYSIVNYNPKCIEPLGESKADLDIELALADKLGILEEYREDNKTTDGWIKKFWLMTNVPKYMTYEEWKRKGYLVHPFPDKFSPSVPMFRDYYQAEDVTKLKGGLLLETPSHKIEFESQLLKKWFPNDEERPPVPHYIPPPETVDPLLSSKYPLIMMTPHSQYRMHTISSEVSWLKEIPSYKMKGADGYFYECLWIHPKDAAIRGIKNGNIIKAWNDRATVLFAAYVTERIIPGMVRACESARYDPVDQHAPDIVDRGGCVALLCSDRPTSKHASGMSVNCFRVQVAKWKDQ